MPSDRPDRLSWLRSQGLGLVCGFLTVLLLAVGSVVLAATRDGASAAVGMDDLRGFFTPVSWVHTWLYLLFPVAALYGVNTVLATWDTVSRRWRGGVRAPSAYAASIVHVGFLLAFVAHGVGGFWGEDRGGVVLTSGWQEVPGIGEARLVSITTELLPGGMPKRVDGRVELRGPDGAVREAPLGYNVPLATAGAGVVALLAEQGRVWVAQLGSSGAGCALAEGQSCRLGQDQLTLVGVGPGPGGAAVRVVARGASGREELRALAVREEIALASGRPLRLERLAPEQAVLLRVREAPGNPWALAAAVVLSLGLALMWRRFLPRRATAADPEGAGDLDAPAPAGGERAG